MAGEYFKPKFIGRTETKKKMYKSRTETTTITLIHCLSHVSVARSFIDLVRELPAIPQFKMMFYFARQRSVRWTSDQAIRVQALARTLRSVLGQDT